MQRISLHLYQSTLTHESRILKETTSLIAADLVDRCIVLGIWDKGLAEKEEIAKGITFLRFKLLTRIPGMNRFSRIFYLTEWLIRSAWYLRKFPNSVVHCHSVLTLPLGAWAKRSLGCYLIYDAHELETERNGLKGVQKTFVKFLERTLIDDADDIFVVNSTIRDWYVSKYGERVAACTKVLRNFPAASVIPAKATSLRATLKIPDDELLFLYQGFLGKGRGIEILLKVFSRMGDRKHLVFLGNGELAPLISEYKKKHPQIHLHPMVPPSEVLNYTTEADVGLCLIEASCLSYQYSSPNKLYEYLRSGLPVVTSDFPAMSEVVRTHDCGWSVAVEEKSVFDFLSSLDYRAIEACRTRVLECRDQFTWESEKAILLQTYSEKFSEASI